MFVTCSASCHAVFSNVMTRSAMMTMDEMSDARSGFAVGLAFELLSSALCCQLLSVTVLPVLLFHDMVV